MKDQCLVHQSVCPLYNGQHYFFVRYLFNVHDLNRLMFLNHISRLSIPSHRHLNLQESCSSTAFLVALRDCQVITKLVEHLNTRIFTYHLGFTRELFCSVPFSWRNTSSNICKQSLPLNKLKQFSRYDII